MSNISVAIVENNIVVNVGEFDGETFSADMWSELVPQWELVPLADLPEGAWIGWQRDENGEWFDSNTPEPEAEE